MMWRAPMRRIENACQRVGGDLAGLAGDAGKLDAAAKEFRRAAFVGRDMGFRVADDGAPRRCQMRERQGIGRRPGRHQEDGDLTFEDVRETFLDPFGEASAP